MVLEDLAGDGRGGDYNAELGPQSELVDWAVGVGQAREVGVELRVQREKVPD